jgi:hypothetical protein
MAENKFSSYYHPDSESAETPVDIHERAIALQKKVSELSRTLDHIEQTLTEAHEERPDSRD